MHQAHSLSRRRALQFGAVTAGATLLGFSGAGAVANAGPVPPDADEAVGADGASAGDTRFARRFAAARETLDSAVMTSYNDWPVGSPASTIGVSWYAVPGTSPTVNLQVKSGDVATVMMYVARRFNAEVEPLVDDYSSAYAYRMNVNNPSVWSNHASGTAMDLNFDQHPNGVAVSRTFSSGQVSKIRSILDDCNGVMFWGGDYTGTVDAMHFEINVSPGDSRLTSLAARIRGGGGSSLRSRANSRFVTAESAGTRPLIANRTAIGPWERFDVINRGGSSVALRAHANNRYVCAESAGAASLIANRTVIGPWETFTLLRNTDGTVSLRAAVNGKLVCAEGAGSLSLRPNRTVIGPWEKFDLIT
jgi:hypothetical protein